LPNWENYKGRGDTRSDEDIAHEVAARVTKTVAIEPEKRTTPAGDKRKPVRGNATQTPLNGCKLEQSDIIRHVIGMKYSGYTQQEAFKSAGEKYDMDSGAVRSLIVRKQEATELADSEHLERCLKAYHSNLWMVRTALSEAGPRAVRTLLEVMDSKGSSEATRMKAAVAVLKMIDVDGSANANPSEKIASESLKLIKTIRTDIEQEKESHVVDCEDAEVVKDHASEN
jgi:hypothetical protein